MRARRLGEGRNRGFWLGGCGILLMLASNAQAQIDLSFTQRAQDGTVYQVVSFGSMLGGTDAARVTTLAGSVNGTQACSVSGNSSGSSSSAAAGVDPTVPQLLHPYDETFRTGLIVDASNLTFTPIGSGRLTLGTGGNQVEVCRESNLCSGGAPNAAIYSLDSSSGGIPAACIAQSFSATCLGAATLNALAFGLPASGTPPICTGSPTTNSTVCGAAPTDGFTLLPNQAVVFIYNHSLGMQGISVAAGGFGIDTDGTDAASCTPTNVVVASSSLSLSAPPLPPIPGVRAPAVSPIGLGITGAMLALAGAVRVMRRRLS